MSDRPLSLQAGGRGSESPQVHTPTHGNIQLDLCGHDIIARKIEIAKSVIAEAHNKSEKPLIVNFSGGKDSCCTLLLALDVTDDVECLYMKSGIDLPGSVDFVERQAKQFGVKLHITDPVRDYYGGFAYWVRRFGYFPNVIVNYCSSRLKLRPARAYLRKIYGNAALYKLTGVRRFESSRRVQIYSANQYIQEDWEHSGSYIVHPLLDWTDDDVKQFLNMRDFEINKNYKPFGVSGCYWCPFYEEKIYRRILKVYPNIYDEIISLEHEMGKPSVINHRFLGDIKSEEVPA